MFSNPSVYLISTIASFQDTKASNMFLPDATSNFSVCIDMFRMFAPSKDEAEHTRS
jgi:hypothetical protein